jgi:hypothetical protein
VTFGDISIGGEFTLPNGHRYRRVEDGECCGQRINALDLTTRIYDYFADGFTVAAL